MMRKRYWISLLCIASLLILFVALPIIFWAKPWSADGYYTQPWVLDSMNPLKREHKYMHIDGDTYRIYMVSNETPSLLNHGRIDNIRPHTMTWTDQQGTTSTVKFISYSYKHSQGISKIYNPFKLFMIKWYEMNQD